MPAKIQERVFAREDKERLNEKTRSAGRTAVSAESYLAEHVRLAQLEDDAPPQDEQLLYDRAPQDGGG